MAKKTDKKTTTRARSQAGTRAKTLAIPRSQSEVEAASEVPHEYVAVRAHQIFLSRGARHGRDLDDWLQAERELLAEHSQLAS